MFTLRLILIGLFGTCISLKQSEVNSIMTLMKEVIDADAVANFGHSMLAPGIVRLIFHDCLGGCDGCIDKSNVGNAGLEQYIAQLEPVYEEIINNMEIPITHADFWTLASIYAIQHCSREDRFSDYLPQPRFRYGRKDCGSTSPYTEEPGKVFPDGMWNGDAIITFMTDAFGYTPREIVALMGAHTLGHVSQKFSGFKGRWVKHRDRFDNEFYVDIVNSSKRWIQEEHPIKGGRIIKYQWRQTRGEPEDTENMMLNSDIGLYKDLTLKDTGRATCNYKSCPLADTSQDMLDFAADNDLWLREFTDVFEKLIETGYDEGTLEYPEETVEIL